MGLVDITKFTACVSFLTLCMSSAAHANPSGATVAHGTVSFNQPNVSTLNITNTPGAIVNWQQFGIAQGELTRFIQQSASSAILNRVTGQEPSQILGQLQSNGRVFLINPNGVIFGQNAVIDTAGMIASTLNLSDDNFLNGHLHFEDLANNASILNQGFIHTSNAGEVVLVAPTVQNEGVIDVEDGHLVLAAGQSVTISSLNYDNIEFEVQAPANKVVNIGDMLSDGGSIGVFAGSIHNSGTISANAIKVNDAGEIVLVAQGDNVQQGGTVTASSETGQGGHIEILGERVGLFGETTVDASGASGGGEVLVGGDYQGGGITQTATTTQVSDTASIHADATEAGDGGKVIVWADDFTLFYGEATAHAGFMLGDGGFIEISGKQNLGFNGIADASAPQGRTGSVLFDPLNIFVADGGMVTVPPSGIIKFTDSPGLTLSIDADSITAITNNFNDVRLEATNDITINENIITSTRDGTGSISLNAGSSVFINADIQMVSSNLLIEAGYDILISGDSNPVTVSANAVKLHSGNNLTLRTGLNAGTGGSVIVQSTNGNITARAGGTLTFTVGNSYTDSNTDALLIADGGNAYLEYTYCSGCAIVVTPNPRTNGNNDIGVNAKDIIQNPVFWDDNTSDGMWETATNWSTGALPGQSATVVADAFSDALTLSSTQQIGSVYIDNTFDMNAGSTLQIDYGAVLQVNGIYNFNGGVLNLSNASAEINGVMNWTGSATIMGDLIATGGPQFFVNTGGTLNFSGSSQNFKFEHVGIQNSGRVLAASTGSSTIQLNQASEYVNDGITEFKGDTLFSTLDTGSIDNASLGKFSNISGASKISVTFNNTGTLNINHGSLTFDKALVNTTTGVVNIDGGTLVLSEAGTPSDNGIYSLTAGTLQISSNRNFPGGGLNFTGGTFRIDSGAVVNLNPATGSVSSFSNLVLDGSATLSGADAININGVFDWVSGTYSAGLLTINPGAAMNVSAPSAALNTALTNSGVIDIQSGALTISGNYTQSAGSLSGVNATTIAGLTSLSGGSLGGAGAFNANGGVNISGALTLDTVLKTAASSTVSGAGAVSGTGAISNSGSFDIQNDGALAVDVSNSGSLIKSAGTSTSIAILTNSGTINIQSGVLTVAGLTSLSGGSLGGAGAFDANGGVNVTGAVSLDTVFNVTGGSMADGAALSDGGSGAFNLVGGTFTVDGSNVIDTAITIQGGTFDVLASGTLNSTASRTVINNNPGGILNIDGEAFVDVINDGSLSGVGSINGNVTNGGDFNPGNSPGTFTINGNLVLLSSSNLNMEIAGLNVGQYDIIDVNGDVTLDGNMNIFVSTGSGYYSQLDDIFTPIKWLSTSGGSIAVVSETSGYSFDSSIGADGFSVVTVSIPDQGIEDVGALPSTEALIFTDTLKAFIDPFVSSSFDEEDEQVKGQTLVCS